MMGLSFRRCGLTLRAASPILTRWQTFRRRGGASLEQACGADGSAWTQKYG
jgi:hypothetical protein